MRHYYLTPSTTQSTDTVFVIDADDHDGAAYLVDRMRCERITRQTALGVDRTHRHTGRGSAWAKPSELVHQAEAQGYPDYILLRATIDDAADATQEAIAYYRGMDDSLI